MRALEPILWGAVAFFCALGWATWMELVADACVCRRHAVNPRCPKHGWEQA